MCHDIISSCQSASNYEIVFSAAGLESARVSSATASTQTFTFHQSQSSSVQMRVTKSDAKFIGSHFCVFHYSVWRKKTPLQNL